jgi:hypothetical protein
MEDTKFPGLGLQQVLESLSEARLQELAQHVGVEFDERKRIGRAVQLARAMASRRDLQRPSAVSPAARDLLVQLARQAGVLPRQDLLVEHEPALEELTAKGWSFELSVGSQRCVVLPVAFILQLPRWEGEEATSARSLLAHLPPALVADVARTFSKRTPVAPWLLALEPAYQALSDPRQIQRLVDELEPAAVDLLQHVARQGGEIATDELLDLERQPMRLHQGGNVARIRRGLGYELERRALLLPVPPNRHLVPSEVMAVLLDKQLRIAKRLRSKARERLQQESTEPLRAQFAFDPTARALAAVAVAAELPAPRKGVGTARRLIKRLASSLGMDPEDAQLLACLSRKAGLWTASSGILGRPVSAIPEALFAAWLEGGVWDEGRLEPEVWRCAKPWPLSPARILRRVAVEALLELAADAWVPWSQLRTFVMADPRLIAIESQFQRYVVRTGETLLEPESALWRIVMHSLVVLGAIDLGDGEAPGETDSVAVRLSSLGNRVLRTANSQETGGETVAAPGPRTDASQPPPPCYEADRVLSVFAGSSVAVQAVLDVLEWAPVGQVQQQLDIELSMANFERALARGAEPETLRQQLNALAAPPPGVVAMLEAAASVEANADFVPAAGFVWIDDPELLQRVRSRRSLNRLFIEPSPPGGLLVAPGVDLDRLVIGCRSVGLDVLVEGERHVLKAKVARRKSGSESTEPHRGSG